MSTIKEIVYTIIIIVTIILTMSFFVSCIVLLLDKYIIPWAHVGVLVALLSPSAGFIMKDRIDIARKNNQENKQITNLIEEIDRNLLLVSGILTKSDNLINESIIPKLKVNLTFLIGRFTNFVKSFQNSSELTIDWDYLTKNNIKLSEIVGFRLVNTLQDEYKLLINYLLRIREEFAASRDDCKVDDFLLRQSHIESHISKFQESLNHHVTELENIKSEFQEKLH